MFLLGYVSLIVAVYWLIRDEREWLARASTARQLALRVSATAITLAFAVAGVALLPGQHDPLLPGMVLALSLIAGGVLYCSGIGLWRGLVAYKLRVAGWVLLVLALVVPSTLTLALPIAAILVLALVPIYGDGRQRSTRPLAKF